MGFTTPPNCFSRKSHREDSILTYVYACVCVVCCVLPHQTRRKKKRWRHRIKVGGGASKKPCGKKSQKHSRVLIQGERRVFSRIGDKSRPQLETTGHCSLESLGALPEELRRRLNPGTRQSLKKHVFSKKKKKEIFYIFFFFFFFLCLFF